jgi:N-acetylglucosamine kinase-like BadF-type ATPase
MNGSNTDADGPLVGVDIGASNLRARLGAPRATPVGGADSAGSANSAAGADKAGDDGQPVARRSLGVRSGGDDEAIDQLTEAVLHALAELLPSGVTPRAVGIGSAGLVVLGDRLARLHHALSAKLGTPLTVVASDALTSYLGALGAPDGRPGAVVAAGTGAVGFGQDGHGDWRRVDGWGYLVGDEGSGAWIGSAGLRAALHAHDGRPGGSPELLRRLVDRFGSPDDMLRVILPRSDRAAVLAAFSTEVVAAAHAGDEIATGIWAQAGRALAETALAALPADARSGASSGARVSWTGGLFGAGALLTEPFRAALTARAPHVEQCAPAGDSMAGALLLADLAVTDPAALPLGPPYLRRYQTS